MRELEALRDGLDRGGGVLVVGFPPEAVLAVRTPLVFAVVVDFDGGSRRELQAQLVALKREVPIFRDDRARPRAALAGVTPHVFADLEDGLVHPRAELGDP